LFLDEIGELPLGLQVKLLRFLQTQAFERVGGCQSIEVDARILAATNVDLRKAIEDGRFREDLYYRLGVVHLILPPLRDRGEDVLLMAKVFLSRLSGQMQKPAPGFSKEAIQALHGYHWPGNVRELFNKIRRAVVMTEGPEIGPRDLDLPYEEEHKHASFSIRGARQHQEQTLILQALTLHNGNISHVARELGVSRTTLYRLMRRYELLGAAWRS
jgi:two-component system NtrC family response regulator